jgi:hypothetical protein
MNNFFTTKLSIIGIWKSGFALYKKAFFKIWYSGLITVIPQSIYFLCIKYKITTCSLFQITFFKYFMIALITNLFVEAVLLHYLYNFVSDTKSKLSKSIHYAASKYLLLLATTITLYYMIHELAKIFSFKNHLLTFAVTYTIFYTVFTFNKQAILFENAGYFRAFKVSIQLVWGNWWRTFVVFFPVALIGLAQSHIFSFTLPHYIVASVLWILFYPYLVSLMLVQFNDLKLRHQANLN